jgi:hypothetical protein
MANIKKHVGWSVVVDSDPLWPAKKCGNVRAWSVSSEKSKVFEPPGNFFG